MKVVVVTNIREVNSLMPQSKFELIKETLSPIQVQILFIDTEDDFSLLDRISSEDIVLVETKDKDTIHQIAIRGLRHTGENYLAVMSDANKIFLRKTGVRMPKLHNGMLDTLEDNKQYFVKPLILEDSIGIDDYSLCTGKKEVRNRANYLLKTFGQPAIIEDYIDGYDVTVGIIRVDDKYVMKASRIDTTVDGVSFQTEKVKTEDLRDFYDMAELDPTIDDVVKKMAAQAFINIGAEHYGRLDFRVTEDGEPYLIEVNLYPGLKNTGAFFRTMAFSGIGYIDFLYMVLNTARRKLI